jgi:hypothetical protein
MYSYILRGQFHQNVFKDSISLYRILEILFQTLGAGPAGHTWQPLNSSLFKSFFFKQKKWLILIYPSKVYDEFGCFL